MRLTNQIRVWKYRAFCLALCLFALGLAGAQTDTSTAAQTKKTPSTAASSPKAQHPASDQASSKKKTTTSTHTTAKSASTSSSSHKSSHKSKSPTGKKTAKKHGQQAIDPTRAREIQAALIREHYMQGEPTGTWDSASQAAMQKYQADQGWQSKTTPDSRALIKLGLGPSHDHLLNPESAMTTPASGASDEPSGAKPAAPENNLPKH